MKSLARPVFCVDPWPKLVVMPATLTPRPTWAGLVPAVSPLGAEPLRSTCDSVSSKTVVLLLKPTVLTLAMLLPATSSLVWWAFRPEMAENMERSMRVAPRVGSGCRGRGSGTSVGGEGHLGDPAEGDGRAVDDGLRLGLGAGAGDPDGADRAGLRRPVGVGVGDRVPDQCPGAQRALQGEQLGVLRGDLLELLHLGEGRGLRHELAAAGRVARVLVAHLRHQQLEEGVLAHLVGAVGRGRGRGGRGPDVAGDRGGGHRFSPGQTRTSTPDDADWSVLGAALPSPSGRAAGSQLRARGSCRPERDSDPWWPARAS